MKTSRYLKSITGLLAILIAVLVGQGAVWADEVEDDELDGYRAGVLIAEGFHPGETPQPIEYLEQKGAEVTIIGIEPGTVEASFGDMELQVEKSVGDVEVDSLDALVIPGGDSPAELREHDEVVEFVKECVQADTVVGAICHGVQMLVSADVLEGREATCVSVDDNWDVAVEVRDAGATFIDAPVVVDGKLVTSRLPRDVEQFQEAVALAMLGRGELEGRTIGVLIEDDFHAGETKRPASFFKERDASVRFLSTEEGTVESGNARYEAESVRDVSPEELDALVIPGGDSPEKLREEDDVLEFVRDCDEAGITIAAICHGPQVLISADLLEGRKAACVVLDDYWDVVKEMREAGGIFVDRPVVTDGNYITSRLPQDIPDFRRAVTQELAD